MSTDQASLRIQTGIELRSDGWYVIVDVNRQRWMFAGPCESEAEAEAKAKEVAKLIRQNVDLHEKGL